MPSPDEVRSLIAQAGGTVDESLIIRDGDGLHGVMTASFPLPKHHWSCAEPEGFNVPPMGLRCGAGELREHLERVVLDAAKYAVRSSTMNGKEADFDPDALIRNMLTGLLGYATEDGLSQDEWANPEAIPPRVVSIERSFAE